LIDGDIDGFIDNEGESEGVFTPLSPITSKVTEHILDRYNFNSSLIESGLLVLIPDTSKTAILPSQQSPIDDGFKLVLGANDFDMVGTNEGV